MFSNFQFVFLNRLEKVTDENERLAEELKFKEQKVQSLQKRFVRTNSCYIRFYCMLMKKKKKQQQQTD